MIWEKSDYFVSKPTSFVVEIDPQLGSKLSEDLVAQGFLLSHPPYTVFSAQKKGINCTLYSSGKLVVQGKEIDEFIKFYLEPQILGVFSYSYPEMEMDGTPRIGIDEAGKGDFFGPLCIAGVQADETMIRDLLKMGVRDSKTLSDKTILALAGRIRGHCPYSVVRLFPKTYNELYGNFKNLNRLLAWGHATAIEELVQKTQCTEVYIDQFASEDVVITALKRKKLQVNLKQRHKGESDPVVAAASILARAAFVNGLEELSQEVGLTLPKGASPAVISAGKALVAKYNEEILEKVAKLHFKTKDEILGA